jgi:hypothetical protein
MSQSSITERPGLNLKKLCVLLALCLAFSALAAYQINKSAFVVEGATYRLLPDDAMITLRVANHIARGEGPYFNAGERVAAATSLGWPILLSPVFHVFDLRRAVLFLQILSVVVTLATFALLALALNYLGGLVVAAIFLLFSPSLLLYSTSSWEHIPQMFLVTAGFLLFIGRLSRSWHPDTRENLALLVLGGAFLIRPDTAPLLLVPSVMFLRRLFRSPDRMAILTCAVLACFCLGYFGSHFHFFGTFVPNTYTLKAEGGSASFVDGVGYLIRTLLDGGNSVFTLCVVGLWLVAGKSWSGREKATLLSIVLFVLYVVSVGGDVFSGGRFLLVVTPLSVYFVAEKLPLLLAAPGPRGVLSVRCAPILLLLACTPVGVVVSAVIQHPSQGRYYGRTELPRVPYVLGALESQVSLAPLIREKLSPQDGEIGLFYLGSLSYYLPEFRVTDFLGKADPVVAASPVREGPIGHNKWDLAHSLGRRNVAVIPLNREARYAARARGQSNRFGFWDALIDHPLTASRYTYLSAPELGMNHRWGLLVRKDLVERFR